MTNKREMHIAMSPLTGTIFCGHLLKDRSAWASDKQDKTLEALVAVAQHVLRFGKPVTITSESGDVEYIIKVESPGSGGSADQ